jgi:hypothetical protein
MSTLKVNAIEKKDADQTLTVKDATLTGTTTLADATITAGSLASGVTGRKVIDANTMFRAYQSTGINLSQTTWTLAPIDTITFDPGNDFDISAGNYKYTIPSSGYYHISAQLNLQSWAPSANNFMTTIRVNGLDYNSGAGPKTQVTRLETAGYQQFVHMPLSYVAHFDANDYLQLWGYIEGSGNRSLGTGEGIAFFSGYKLA